MGGALVPTTAAAARSADGFLCSYPKSGRTWIRFALAHVLDTVHDLELEIDLHSLFSLLPNLDGHEDPGKDATVYGYAGRPEIPLLLSSHLAFDDSLFAGRPIVFLLRSPLDVVVSNYFQRTRQDLSWSGGLGEFIRDPEIGTYDLVRYLNSWADRLARPEVAVVTYEALRAEPERGLIDLADHLGVPCEASTARAALAHASFPSMLAVELASGIRGYEYDRGDPEARRVRRGRVGGYRSYFEPEDARYVADLCAERLSPAAVAVLERHGVAPWAQLS